MKQNRFDFRSLLASFAASSVILALMLFLCYITSGAGWIVRSLMTGLTMALTAFVGFSAVHLMMRTRKHILVRIPKLFSGMTALFCAIILLFGILGQTGYSMLIANESLKPRSDAELCDISLVVDCSDSMGARFDDVSSVSKALINAVTSSHTMSAACFTTQIDSEKPAALMDDTAKEEYAEMIDTRAHQGGTSLTRALEWAYQQLQSGESLKKAVIVISDGSSPIYPETREKLLGSGIKIYSVTLGAGGAMFSDDFSALVTESGGFDTNITMASDISQLDPLVRAFGGLTSDIVNVRETKIYFDEIMILNNSDNRALKGDPGLVIFRLGVQFVFFIGYYLLMQCLYFRKIKGLSILISIGAAAFTTAMVTVSAVLGMAVFSVVALALGMHTLIANLKVEVRYYVR